jgi:hypothetical protein
MIRSDGSGAAYCRGCLPAVTAVYDRQSALPSCVRAGSAHRYNLLRYTQSVRPREPGFRFQGSTDR